MKTEKILSQNIRCYDNGGKSADRFTVVYMDQPENRPGTFGAVGMNAEPFHPQGIGQHTSAMPGAHLGARIAFASLPGDCQKMVLQDLRSVRLEYLRAELRAERISYGELTELQGLSPFIPAEDTELREAAGIPEGE